MRLVELITWWHNEECHPGPLLMCDHSLCSAVADEIRQHHRTKLGPEYWLGHITPQ